MTDETNDDGEKKKQFELKSIEDYKNPEEENKTIDLQKAKEKKLKREDDGRPTLKTKFDFEDDGHFFLMDIDANSKEEVVLTYMEVHHHDKRQMGPFTMAGGWCGSNIGRKFVKLKWYDFFLGVNTLEQKVDNVATVWMNEIKTNVDFANEVEKISEKFSRS